MCVRVWPSGGKKFSCIAKSIGGLEMERYQQAQAGGHTFGLSAITLCKLEFGAPLNGKYSAEAVAVQKVLAPFELCDYDAIHCPRHYGLIRHDLERQGRRIGSMDLLIAAQALAMDAVLISNNVGHFSRVPGLKVENWLRPGH